MAKSSFSIFQDYTKIIHTYIYHFSQSEKFQKPAASDKLYLLINGFNTLTHVFKIILRSTFDSDWALENMEKSLYYYTQFIEQMDENILYDLNISSNSASIFVYKKTIGEIDLGLGVIETAGQRDMLKNINIYLSLYEPFFYKIFQNKAATPSIEESLNQLSKKVQELQELETVTP